MKNFEHYLFSAIYFADDCPDGDVTFVHENYIEWADKFESWLKGQPYYGTNGWKRYRDKDCERFQDNEQAIYFSNNPTICPWSCPVISLWEKPFAGRQLMKESLENE